MVAAGAISGSSSPWCMMSRTKCRLAPSLPPGWKTRNFSAVKPCRSRSAIASASPSASCISVEVVGARPCGQASSARGRMRATSAPRASVLSAAAVMAISGRRKRPAYSTRLRSSAAPSPPTTIAPGSRRPRRSCRDRRSRLRWGGRRRRERRSRQASLQPCRPMWPALADAADHHLAGRGSVDRLDGGSRAGADSPLLSAFSRATSPARSVATERSADAAASFAIRAVDLRRPTMLETNFFPPASDRGLAGFPDPRNRPGKASATFR